MIRALALALAVLIAGPANAQDAAAAAEAARDRLAEAGRQLQAAGGARDRISALTATVQAYEDGLVAMREGLRRAALREETLTRKLDSQSEEVAQLLGVLQTMGRAPAPLLLLHPSGPLGTARGGMILSDVTPALQAKAEGLRGELEEVSRLRALQDGAAETLREGLDGAQAARAALADAVDTRSDLPRRFTEDPVQAALLIASAETLDGFAKMLGDVETGGDLPPPDTLKGELSPPVTGQLARAFNAPGPSGARRPGVTLATRPRALVTLPAPATLRFSGPLLDYGTVAIIEPAADVLIVMAGLAEVFGEVGQVLPAGSPLGLMGGTPPDADGILNDGEGARLSESLYIEVREHGDPVDPATWFVLE